KVGKKVNADYTDEGRHTRGVSEFTVSLDARNAGALLRRTLDYSFPNQTAEVYVADVSTGAKAASPAWERAGIWYLAGSTAHLYSRPRARAGEPQEAAELDKRIYDVKIS